MKKFKYLLEVEIVIDEENINEKYPNYTFNYGSVEEFADAIVIADSYETDMDTTKDSLNRFGYSIEKKRVRVS